MSTSAKAAGTGLFDRPGWWPWLGRYLWSCRSLGSRAMGVSFVAAFLVWLVGGLLPMDAATSAVLYEATRAAMLVVLVAWTARWAARWRRHGVDVVSGMRLRPAAQWVLRISLAVVVVGVVVLGYSGAAVTPVVTVTLAASGPTLPPALTAVLLALLLAAIGSALTLVVVEAVRTSRRRDHRDP